MPSRSLLVGILLSLYALSLTAFAQKPWLEEKYSVGRTGFYPGNWSWGGRRIVDYNVSVILRAGLCIASSPVVADLNGDGVSDIVVNSCDGYTYAISGESYKILWRRRTGLGLVSPAAADLNGDGVLDIVVAGPGILYCLRGDNGAVEWSVKGLFYKATPAIADVDCDGSLDVIANTLDGKVAIIAGNGSVKAWVRVGSQEVSIPAVGDVNGDGCPDVVVAENSAVHIVSYSNGSWRVYTVKLDSRVTGYPSLYDINRDRVDDILVATSRYLYAIDVKRHELLWRARISGYSYSSPSVGDVDGDGEPDVVLATSDGIYVFSLSGKKEYFFGGVNADFGSVIISDVDGDGHNEMIVARYDGEIDIVDLTRSKNYYDAVEFLYVTQGPLMKPAVIGDVDGDGLPEIIVGSRDFNLYLIDGVAAQPRTSSMKTTTATQAATTRIGSATSVASTTMTSIAAKTGTNITKSYIAASSTQAKTELSTKKARTPLPVASGPSSGLPQPNYRLIAALAVFLAAVSALILLYVRTRSS